MDYFILVVRNRFIGKLVPSIVFNKLLVRSIECQVRKASPQPTKPWYTGLASITITGLLDTIIYYGLKGNINRPFALFNDVAMLTHYQKGMLTRGAMVGLRQCMVLPEEKCLIGMINSEHPDLSYPELVRTYNQQLPFLRILVKDLLVGIPYYCMQFMSQEMILLLLRPFLMRNPSLHSNKDSIMYSILEDSLIVLLSILITYPLRTIDYNHYYYNTSNQYSWKDILRLRYDAMEPSSLAGYYNGMGYYMLYSLCMIPSIILLQRSLPRWLGYHCTPIHSISFH